MKTIILTAILAGSIANASSKCSDQNYNDEKTHAHSNGGGIVSETASVEDGVFVGPEAIVCNFAKITGAVRLEGKSMVDARAEISGQVVLTDAYVGGYVTPVSSPVKFFGSPKVSEAVKLKRTTVTDEARISGRANLENGIVQGKAVITDEVQAKGQYRIEENAVVSKNAVINGTGRGGPTTIKGRALVTDTSTINDGATIMDDAQVRGGSKVMGSALIMDSAKVIDSIVSSAIVKGAIELRNAECSNAKTCEPEYAETVYFGQLEVTNRALKTASGRLPKPGQLVKLQVFLPEVARFVSGAYHMALYPKLWVRFDGGNFQEIPNLPQGSYNMRGPMDNWEKSEAEIALKLPAHADRIELYMHFGRIAWSGYSCYQAYDMMECPDYHGIEGAWLSNNANNFAIPVK
jgi:carbonic anhydrase/acetyltransferase-like protein (isoleucine patch superfamily)